MDNENNVNDPLELTADEQAYFDRGGETEEVQNAAPEPVEPEPQVAEADDTEEDDDDASPEQGKRPGFVPHRKLHKALEKLKAKEADLEKERIERARLEERTNMLLQRFQQQPLPVQTQTQQPEPAPNPQDDIFGAVEHQAKTLAQLQQEAETRRKAEEEQQKVGALLQRANLSVEEFKRSTPDYSDAYQHLRRSRAEELAMLGYPADAIEKTLYNDELAIAARAVQAGKNVGEIVYNLSKQRGYARKEAAPVDNDPAEKIARTADAQARSATLSHAGGASAPATIDARAVARMSEDDFFAFMSKNKKALDQLMMG